MLAIEDYRLYYNYRFIDSDHPTLFLIHGLSQDSELWNTFISYIDPSFNVVTYDFSGHGQTTQSTGRVTFKWLIREAVTLIHKLHLKHIHLIGNYFGGLLAVWIAERCIDKVDSLSLFSTPFFVPKGSFKQELRYMGHLIQTDRPMLGKVFAMRAVHPATPAKSKYILRSFHRMSTRIFLDILTECERANDFFEFAVLDNLQALHLPILFLYGEYDNLMPKNLAIAFTAMVPNSRGFVIPGAGRHFVIDDPLATANLVNKFILDDQSPVPMTPMYENYMDHFKKVIMEGYRQSLQKPCALQIQVMSRDFRVTWKGLPVEGTWNQRHAKELLLFLVMNGGTVTRDQIIDILIPEVPVVQAKSRLRVALAHLNKLFREHSDPSLRHILIISRTAITLNTEVSCDLTEFLEAVEQLKKGAAPLSDQAKEFVHLTELYHPEFLVSLGGEWLNACIEQLDRDLGLAMRELIQQLENEGLNAMTRSVLSAGKNVEPYEGFCEDTMRLQNHGKNLKNAK